jgi:hypothetical protein
MGDSTVPVISHSGGVDRLLRHHGHRRTAASLSRNVAPGYRRGVPAWAQLGQARGGWRLRHGVGAALDCGRLVVATDEEFAREPSRLDEGLAMAPRNVDEQARRRYPATTALGAGCHALGPSSPGALRAQNARALGAALVACSRRLRTATAVKLCARDARSVTLVKSSVTLLDRDASNAIGEGYTLRPLEEISSRARFVWCHPREDIEFVIGDDEVLEEAALAARHRPGGDPPAGLLRDI